MIEPLKGAAYDKRLAHILTHPNLLDEICAHVANGGTVQTLVDTWEIRYSDITNWLRQDPARDQRYIAALNDRGEWGKERFLSELRTMGIVNVRQAFNADGTLKPVHEIPEDVIRCIEGIEVDELWEGAGAERVQVGVTKKIKLASKLKSLEMLLKNAGLLTERIHLTASKKLEDLLAESNKKEELASASPAPAPTHERSPESLGPARSPEPEAR